MQMQIIINPLDKLFNFQRKRTNEAGGRAQRTSVPKSVTSSISIHAYPFSYTHAYGLVRRCVPVCSSFISLVALLISSQAHSNGNSCRIMPIKFVLLKNSFAKKFHKSNKYRVPLQYKRYKDKAADRGPGSVAGAVNMPHEGRSGSAGPFLPEREKNIQLCLLGHQFLKAPWAARSKLCGKQFKRY